MNNATTKPANREIGVPRKHALAKNGARGDESPGWHNRGYLPHFESAEFAQHVTFHLADSLPQNVLKQLHLQLNAPPPENRDAERRKRLDAWLDAGHGSCVLRKPDVATIVQDALLHFDSQRYRLLSWVVMPNHVHVLFQPISGWSLAEIVASWKKHTSRKIRDYGRARGARIRIPVWHREYWDRYIRNEAHLKKAIDYIHSNPVKVGFVAKAEAWRWSSAFPANASATLMP